MPNVSIDIKQLSGIDPGVDASRASFDFWPYAPVHVIDDAANYLLNKNILRVKTVDGLAATEIPETPAGNAMWVQGRGYKGADKWLVAIPATDCNLWDLPHLDPETLDPTAPLSPAWLAGLEAVQAGLGNKVNTSTYTAGMGAEASARDEADQLLATTISDYAATLNTALGTKATITSVAVKRDDPWRYDSTRGRAIKAALAKRATTPVDIVGMGASWMAGSGAGSTAARWWDLAQAAARTRWPVTGAAGSLGYRESYSYTPGYMTPFTYTGTPTVNANFGLGRKTLVIPNGQNVTMTIPTGGTGVRIVYGKGPTGGNFTWKVAAGSATTVSANAGVASTAVLNIVAAPGELVTIAATTAGLYFQGAYFFGGDETKGVRMWNGGTSGYRTADFVDATGWTYDSIGAIDPDLFIIDLGANDYSGGTALTPVSVATYKANLATLVSNVRTRCTKPPTILLQLFPQITNGSVTTLAPWADYRTAALEWAAADGLVGVWDLAPIFGSMTGTDTYGLTAGDLAHPGPAGYAAIADQFVDILSTP